jgi:outer membrane receptor protein involved in Fe transport
MPGGGQRSGMESAGMPKEGMITGRVLENGSGIPMEFVNIVLFRAKDSTMVTGTITDAAGKFSMKELPFGRFYLTANFIGYEKTIKDSLFINPQQKSMDIGTISLNIAATNLEGVEIVADRDRVTYQLDKKIVNVSQDLKSAGGTAIDVLENVPSVKVDIEGNVTMRGSGSFTVLIDGRPSVLEANDALQQIPAASIDHIEIITNPSVKFDPDGTAGIINVVTKKTKAAGLNGIVNASIGTNNKYSADALFNYRTGKVNLFAGADYRLWNMRAEGESENLTYSGDTTFYRITDSHNKMNRDGYGFKAGIDYFINDQATLTLSGKYGYYDFGRNRNGDMTFYSDPIMDQEYAHSKNSSEREGTYYEATANYVRKLDQKGQKLELMGFFSNRNGDDREEQEEFPTDSEWNPVGPAEDMVLTIETDNSFDYLIKADYTLPFNTVSKLEAGYQSRFYIDEELYDFYDFDTLYNSWTENELYSNDVDFRRDIHSLYSTYANEWKGFGFQLGLRGEYSYRSIKNVKSDEASVLDRFDLFPSIHISKGFLENQQVMLSYSRRINRVRAQMLDPFVSYMDPYNIRQGNPDLKDEYIDSYDLGYQYKFEKSFIALDVYYRVTHNLISRITTMQDNGILLTTFENQNKDHALGGEITWNGDVTKWLNLFATADAYYYRLEGEAEGEAVDEDDFTWEARLTASIKLKHDIRFQLTGSYVGPKITVQGREEGYFMSNLSARKDFFERKLSVTLSGRDLFRSAKQEQTTSGEGFYNHSLFRRESPMIMLNVSYRINNYKQQNRQDNMDRNGDDDMDM